MTVLIGASTGQSIALVEQIASSGEGTVWKTDRNGYLAKIYHSSHHERVKKLEVMVANPPTELNSHLNHISFAWPQELLTDRNGSVLGFLMPEIKDAKELLDVYSPQRRKKLKLEVNWYFLHTTALNIASFIQLIHAKGYVLGDIKPQNILVNNRTLPSIIDTDSFQVRHPNTGEVYRCLVGTEGFTPVELLDKDFHITDQTEVHDRFRLAVIVYLLLFGAEPFKGKWVKEGDSPAPSELIRQGFWPYAPNSLIQPGPLTIPLNIVHPEIQRCFLRCFNDGHTKPHLRPTAGEWYKALEVAIADLTDCDQITNHYHSKSYGKCYWCDRAVQLGVDIFPGVPRVKIQPTATVAPSHSKVFAADNVPELLKQKEKTITVVGRAFNIIDNSNNNPHKPFCINFDDTTSPSCKDGSFRIVISGPGLQKLAQIQGIQPEGLKTWKGQFIRITGLLDIYQAKKRCFTQVTLEDPAQLELLAEPEFKRLLGQAFNEPTFKTKPIKAAPNQRPAEAKTAQTTNNLLFETENQEISLCRQGRVHARQRKYGAAIQCYDQALLLKPDYGIAYYYRGMAHQRVGDKLKATKDFLEAKRLGVQLPASDYLN
ncbi:tetratricopeptide repeat protein [Microcoleus sp. AR_TQ3_B6]|uniref:protein kinase domain-containing protein n=1 Tax=Microcoleus sp. AR_TQ3_B6 TaxID=3055284 RepID=UPI002FD04C6D